MRKRSREAGSVRQVLYSPRLEANPRGARLLSAARRKFQEAEWIEVDDEVLASISDTRSPQGILAVLKKREWTWKDVEPERARFCVSTTFRTPGTWGRSFASWKRGGAPDSF